MSLPGPFTPTHQVPGSGLPVWTTPDPSAPAVATLDPGLPVQTVQRWGDWASIVCSNGWGGWVDGRALLPAVPQAPPPAAPGAWSPGPEPYAPPPPVPAPAPPPASWPGATYGTSPPAAPPPGSWPAGAYGAPVPPPPPAAASWAGLQQAFRWPPPPWLAGAALVLLGLLFSWADIAGFGTGAFDIPIQFLFDRTEIAGGIKVGLLVLVLLGLGGAAWARPHHPLLGKATGRVWGQAAGGIVVAVALAFALQWNRYLGLYPKENRPGFVGSLGIGFYVTIVGGVLLIVGDRPWPRGRR